MGTTSARLAALSFATLTVISIAAILLTFARMIQPGDAETIMGMNVSLWYIFAATSAILSFALFALFTTLDSIRESNERIADVLEDADVAPPARADSSAAENQPALVAVQNSQSRFRVTGVDRATGMQTSVIVEAKDKAEATLRARDKGVRDLSRVEYIRRSTAASLQQQSHGAQQIQRQPVAHQPQPQRLSPPPPPGQVPLIRTTPSQQISLRPESGPTLPLEQSANAPGSTAPPSVQSPSPHPVSQPATSEPLDD